MKYLLIFIAVVFLKEAWGKTLNEKSKRTFADLHLNKKDTSSLSLLSRLSRVFEKRQTNSFDIIMQNIRCDQSEADNIRQYFLEPEANLECVYGYVMQDWLKTFDDIALDSKRLRSPSFKATMACLDGILRSAIQSAINAKGGHMNYIPDYCNRWTGRFKHELTGHPYSQCNATLWTKGWSPAFLQSLVTVNTACVMHRDAELLEGIVASVGAKGPLGLSSTVAPAELCAFNSIKRDARWVRVNMGDNGCTYRLETKK